MTKAKAQEQGEAVAAVVAEQRIARQGDTPEVMELLKMAMREDVPVEKLERLLTLHERVQDRNNAQEFAASRAAFQRDCPQIKKTSKASVRMKSGGSYSYTYPELDHIERTVRPHLTAHGLTYDWDQGEWSDKSVMSICTLTHINGHSKSSRFTAPIDSSNTKMDTTKRATSAHTVAKRQALLMVLGLTTCDPDTDGNVASDEKITEQQAFDLHTMIVDTGGNEARFLKFAGVKALDDILATDYASLVQHVKRVAEKR